MEAPRSFVVTPSCPICLKSYDARPTPKILYPCGHGMCAECIDTYREHEGDEMKCPLCREVIVQDFENYDLQDITSGVNRDTLSYWSQRLLEILDRNGEIVHLDKQLMPFCRALYTRIAYSDDLKVLDGVDADVWSVDDRARVALLTKTFLRALQTSDVPIEDALRWIYVLNTPSLVENELIQHVNKFYANKEFLRSMKADWLLDTLLN